MQKKLEEMKLDESNSTVKVVGSYGMVVQCRKNEIDCIKAFNHAIHFMNTSDYANAIYHFVIAANMAKVIENIGLQIALTNMLHIFFKPLKKENIFFYIKSLDADKQKDLLRPCLVKPQTPPPNNDFGFQALALKFWEPQGDHECSTWRGTLKQIGKHLQELDKQDAHLRAAKPLLTQGTFKPAHARANVQAAVINDTSCEL